MEETLVMTLTEETLVITLTEETLVMTLTEETLVITLTEETLVMTLTEETLVITLTEETLVMTLTEETLGSDDAGARITGASPSRSLLVLTLGPADGLPCQWSPPSESLPSMRRPCRAPA